MVQAPDNQQVYSPLSKLGNQPVVVGNRLTNVAHFSQCRYENITQTLEGQPAVTIFRLK